MDLFGLSIMEVCVLFMLIVGTGAWIEAQIDKFTGRKS